LIHDVIDHFLYFARQPPQASQRRNGALIVLGGQLREQFVANAISCELKFLIGAICAEWLAELPQILCDLLAAEGQQRPNQRDARQKLADGSNSGQAGNARSSNNAVQNRLGLVVRRMCRDQVACTVTQADSAKESVPGIASVPFRRQVRLRCSRTGVTLTARHVQIAAQPSDEISVFVGIWPAETVMKVGDDQSSRTRLPHGVQAAQQGHAVGTTGYGDDIRHVAPEIWRPSLDECLFEGYCHAVECKLQESGGKSR
jgi:hypothetical protein